MDLQPKQQGVIKMSISKNNDRLVVIISKELKTQLGALAEKDGRTVSNYVKVLLENHVKNKQ